MKRFFIISNAARLYLAILTWAIFSPLLSQGQGLTVTGTVTVEPDQSTVPGVNVVVKGTTQGTVTDIEGNYRLSVPNENDTLVFSFVGYANKEVPLNGQTTLNVTLSEDVEQLQEVVVVGYGTQKKRDVTGAVASVQGEDITKQPVLTPTQAAQGKVAGVQIISSGAPNSQPTVRIRGTGSMLAGANPLYVVDGVITDDIRNINTSDIVSMDILKDASATAIYGMRAANGVVIINTKKGKEGKPQVTYNGNMGIRQAAKVVDMANASQYVDFLGDVAPDVTIPDYSGSTSWFNEVLRNAFYQNHNISISGGTDKLTYYFSGGYYTDQGIVLGNNFKRFTLRSNNEYNISSKFKLGSQLSFSRGITQDVDVSGALNSAYRAAPIIPGKVDGKYGNTSAFGNVGNPLLSIDKNNNRLQENRLQGNAYLEFDPVDYLMFRSSFGTDVSFNNRRIYGYQFFNDEATFIAAGGNQQNQNSNLSVRQENSLRWVWDNTVTFTKSFGQHNLTLLGGITSEQLSSTFLLGSRINVPASSDLWYLGLGDPDVQSTNDNGGDKWTRNSYISRVNYSYADRYLLTATFRADGTSRFAASNRWGYFPSVGLGWVISEEGFMQGQNILDNLKLRGSWGRVGNDNIATNQYIVTADVNIPYFFNNQLVLGSAVQDIKNQDIRWEITEEYDAGLEFGFSNGRLTGEIDYYNKKTKDALVIVNLPGILGDPDNQYVTNAGTFSNKGWELALNWKNKITDDWSYNVGGNITFNKNEIIGLNQGQALFDGGVGQQGFVTKSDNGQPIGSFFVLQSEGVFQNQQEIDSYVHNGVLIQPDAQPGDLKYLDVNDDGSITPDDRVYAGSYQPKTYFGINGGITYKNFDLTADFYGNAGNKVYNGKKAFRYQITDNIEADFAQNRWTASNHSNTNPSNIISSTPASTYFVESGTFFRLNNLTLGYTLPSSTLESLHIANLRVFLTSQNLFTAQKFSGFSPELIGDSPLNSGIELGVYPINRTMAFGLNVTF